MVLQRLAMKIWVMTDETPLVTLALAEAMVAAAYERCAMECWHMAQQYRAAPDDDGVEHWLSEAENAIRALPAGRVIGAELAWQLVETAPADVPLILYCPHRHETNQERIEIAVFRNTRGGSEHAWATHWMPLIPGPNV